MNEVEATGYNIPPNVSVESLDKERFAKRKENKKNDINNTKLSKCKKHLFPLFNDK